MGFRRFEEISAWQTARGIAREIYRISANEPFAKDFGLRDQVQRAAVSIMSNIAEGFSRRSDREFSRYLLLAKSSAGELQSQLYVALDQAYLTGNGFGDVRVDHRPGMM